MGRWVGGWVGWWCTKKIYAKHVFFLTSIVLSNAHKLKDLEHSLPKQNTRPSLLEVCASAKEEGDGGGEGTDWEGEGRGRGRLGEGKLEVGFWGKGWPRFRLIHFVSACICVSLCALLCVRVFVCVP